MKKIFPGLFFALLPLFHVHAMAAGAEAPLVCNAAETAKVCRDYSPKLNTDNPDSDRFYAALAACAGPDNHGQRDDDAHPGRQQRYSDCQDDPRINALRLKGNEVIEAIRQKHAWLQKRCDPDAARSRVCGTSPESQITSSQKREQPSSAKQTQSGPMLTGEDRSARSGDLRKKNELAAREQEASQLAWDKANAQRVAQAEVDKELAQMDRDRKTREFCRAKGDAASGYCECSRFAPPPPPLPGKAARGCTK